MALMIPLFDPPRNAEPQGIRFYDVARQNHMLLLDDAHHPLNGWLCYKHPDGKWVSLRKATDNDHIQITRMLRHELDIARNLLSRIDGNNLWSNARDSFLRRTENLS
jgi:hypothetical protein